MPIKHEVREMRTAFEALTLYQKFEQLCVIALTALIAVIAIFALWHLALNVLRAILDNTFDPTNNAVFQTVFGMIFTVIIALEFKGSLTALGERQIGVVHVRAVLLIALLAVMRKLIILDVEHTDAMHLFALAAAILALGGVYWLVRDQEMRLRERERTRS
ncbi:MAG TPA: phosphate-starvation-inducible PsiE family protein [Pseudolabrys sp.]